MTVTIGLNPYLVDYPVAITWYLVLLLAGLLISLFIAIKLSGKYGLDGRSTLFALLTAIPGGLIGARLFHVIDKFDYYSVNLHLIPLFWTGGFSQYGMLIGGLSFALLFSWLKKLPVWKFLDLIAVPLLIGLSFGRIGCVIHGCCYGNPTGLPWSFTYTNPNSHVAPELLNKALHPAQAYEAIWFLALGSILFLTARYLRPIEGITFLIFIIGHSASRFLIFFSRGEYQELQVALNLTQAQLISVLFFITAVFCLVRRLRLYRQTPSTTNKTPHSKT